MARVGLQHHVYGTGCQVLPPFCCVRNAALFISNVTSSFGGDLTGACYATQSRSWSVQHRQAPPCRASGSLCLCCIPAASNSLGSRQITSPLFVQGLHQVSPIHICSRCCSRVSCTGSDPEAIVSTANTADFPDIGPFDGQTVAFDLVFRSIGGAEFATQWVSAQAALALRRAPPPVIPRNVSLCDPACQPASQWPGAMSSAPLLT